MAKLRQCCDCYRTYHHDAREIAWCEICDWWVCEWCEVNHRKGHSDAMDREECSSAYEEGQERQSETAVGHRSQ